MMKMNFHPVCFSSSFHSCSVLSLPLPKVIICTERGGGYCVDVHNVIISTTSTTLQHPLQPSHPILQHYTTLHSQQPTLHTVQHNTTNTTPHTVLTIHEFGEGRSALKWHNNFSQNQLRADWRRVVDGCQYLGCMLIGPIVKDCGC